jgi:predicted transposase
MKLAVQIKLLPSPEQAATLTATMRAVNRAATFAAAVGFENQVRGLVSIYRLCYRTVRGRFGLGAQHAVRAIGKVCEFLARDMSVCPVFADDGAITLDGRLYRLIGLHTASMNTTGGRVKMPFVVGDYFVGAPSRKTGHADLVCRGGQFFLYVAVEFREEPPVGPKDWAGADPGVKDISNASLRGGV